MNSPGPNGKPGPRSKNPHRGPFGPKCGPEGSTAATWIPDSTPGACDSHDLCYETCAKQCKGTSCKLTCDVVLATKNPVYGFATAQWGDRTYNEMKKKNGCEDEDCGK